MHSLKSVNDQIPQFIIWYSKRLLFLGVLKTKYCPSVSGCRGVVQFKDATDMQSVELTDQDIRLIFNSSRPIWLVGIFELVLSICCVCFENIFIFAEVHIKLAAKHVMCAAEVGSIENHVRSLLQ